MSAPPSEIAVIGAGYVGLTTAVCLAHLGNRVRAVDVDSAKVAQLRRGESPILEAGLPALLEEGIQCGLLSFTTDSAEAASGADFVFLCVPTPQGADGAADLRFVEEAARGVAPHLKAGAVVVTKSTVPVGSAGVVVEALGRADTAVVSNPEFLREGTAVSDWLHPDRVVIGSDDRQAAGRLAGLYEPLGAPIIVTDPASSETIKYACNAFLAAKVSFVNSIANLCAVVGADAVDVIRGMSYDRRIGADHLSPGPGWGGSCFPKDTSALIRIAEDHGYDFALLREAVAANESQFDWVADQVGAAAGRPFDEAVVAAWGLTFKAGTDDLRDSPAVAVLSRLRDRGATVRAYDPTLPDPERWGLSDLGVAVFDDPYLACSGASVLVVLTEWPQFGDLDLGKAARMMHHPAVVDTRNMLDRSAARASGFEYLGMGEILMRVLVAGGAGLIGNALCRTLLDRGEEVVCVDNLVTGSRLNVRALIQRPGMSFLEADVNRELPLEAGFDAVVDLACPASPADFEALALEILETGSRGLANLLEIARRDGATFLQASTSEVYGEPLVHPQPETYWGNVNPVGPRSVYDEAKRFGEALVSAYRRKYGMEVRIARIFNTYGPGMRPGDGRVISNFVLQALEGRPLTVYGDGTQTRSFCYVDDEVDGILRLLGSAYPFPVNIGSDRERTLLEVADMVLQVTGSESAIVFVERPVDDPTHRRPDLTVARRELGWEPTTDLREGLAATVEWFSSLLPL